MANPNKPGVDMSNVHEEEASKSNIARVLASLAEVGTSLDLGTKEEIRKARVAVASLVGQFTTIAADAERALAAPPTARPQSRYDDEPSLWVRDALEELFFGAREIAGHAMKLDAEGEAKLAELPKLYADALEAIRAREDQVAHLEAKLAAVGT